MPAESDRAAREILEIIPLVMRSLRTQLRQPAALPNPGHFRLLHTLAEEGPHNLSELAEKQMVTLPTMSNTISTLSEHGLVRRTKSLDDRRRVVIDLTEKGRTLLQTIRTQAEAHIAGFLEPLSAQERRQLISGLDVLKRAFTNRGEPEDPGAP